MMKKLPFWLIYIRIALAIVIVWLAFSQPLGFEQWIVLLMIVGLVTDVFDGIIARKWNVSSEKLRVWDSNVDQFFWLLVICSVFYLRFDFLQSHLLWIGLILLLEALAYGVSYRKFGKSIATHSLLAKFWTLTLLWFLVDVTLHGSSGIAFLSCIALGIVSRVEIICIIWKLNKWTTDVPSIFAVSKINKGIPLKKSALFNS